MKKREKLQKILKFAFLQNPGCPRSMPAAAFTAVQLTPDSSHFPTLPTFIFWFLSPFLERTEIKFTLLYLKYISKFYQLICQF